MAMFRKAYTTVQTPVDGGPVNLGNRLCCSLVRVKVRVSGRFSNSSLELYNHE